MKRKKTEHAEPLPAKEWARVKEIKAIFGISGATLYAMTKAGRIRSVLLPVTREGKGVRLFDIASIRGAIEDQLNRGETT